MTSKGGGQTVGETLSGLISRLEKISDMPGLDAQVLLAYLLDKPRSWVLAHPEVPITKTEIIPSWRRRLPRLEGGRAAPVHPWHLGILRPGVRGDT